MANERPGPCFRELGVLMGGGTASGLTDRDLLERFLATRDEAAETAFAVLVGRHGPMVRGVCRRMLHDPDYPPVVLKTVPQVGALDVDPALTEIKVTFSKDMQNGSRSWVTLQKDTFPETTGRPKYEKDKRTCVLPVKLAPGKTYAISLNSQRFTNFKDPAGNHAIPYLLLFKTRK